jgi:hypothetical protein
MLRAVRGSGRSTWLLAVLLAAIFVTTPSVAHAGNTDLMTIVPPAGSKTPDSVSLPVYPTRSLTFRVQDDDTFYVGDTLQCSTDRIAQTKDGPVPSDGPWGSCGTPVTAGCPMSECFDYSPPVVGDDMYSVLTRFVDGNGDFEAGGGVANFDFNVDTTPPRTTLTIAYLDGNNGLSPSGDGKHADFTFRADDSSDTFQCALSTSDPAPSDWTPCRSDKDIPFRLVPDSRMYHFRVRAVDEFGRPDPNPDAYTFSPVPCRAKLLTGAHTLRALQRGIRVRITCLEPSAWHFSIAFAGRDARRYKQLGELGGYTGIIRRAAGSRTVTVKALPTADLPVGLGARRLSIAYVIDPGNDDTIGFGAPQRIPGTLRPS